MKLTILLKDADELLLSGTTLQKSGLTFPMTRNTNGAKLEDTGSVKLITPTYNYEKLKDLSKTLTKNLNRIIDYNYYPIPGSKDSI